MTKVFTTCDKCNREIFYGDNYIAIAKNVEKAISPVSSDDKHVQILDSELLITLCSNCAVLLNHDLSGALNKVIIEETNILKPMEEDLLEKALSKVNGRDPLFEDAAHNA
jgi:hypothetical protein